MAEPMGGIHPDSGELQRYADGEESSGRVASHVEACAICREEIAAVRRVTAALSLGSKAPDSLASRIQSRRNAASAERIPIRVPRSRRGARALMLPVGLAAAAALVIFAPRALRDEPGDDKPPAPGAKGAISTDVILLETIVTEAGQSSIDSISWDINGPGLTAEIRYVAGRGDSPRAQRLAERVAAALRAEGVGPTAITVRPETEQPSTRPLPAGAIRVTVRARLP